MARDGQGRKMVHPDQANSRLKAEGLLSLGAILKNSKSMLVLWDDTYLKCLGRVQCQTKISSILLLRSEIPNGGPQTIMVVGATVTFTFSSADRLYGYVYLLYDDIMLGSY